MGWGVWWGWGGVVVGVVALEGWVGAVTTSSALT